MTEDFNITLNERYLIDSWEYVCYQSDSFAKIIEFHLEKQARDLFDVVVPNYIGSSLPKQGNSRDNKVYPRSNIFIQIKGRDDQEIYASIAMFIMFDDDYPQIQFALTDALKNTILYNKNWKLSYDNNYSNKNRFFQVLQNELYMVMNDSSFITYLKSALSANNLFKALSNI